MENGPETQPGTYHVPVQLEEVLRLLDPQPGQAMLDATLGGGGHSAALAERVSPGGMLVAFDRDAEAIMHAGKRLEPLRLTCTIILLHSAFGNMTDALDANPQTASRKFHGALFDLGVSSHQLDTARGFSFRRDEALDMRMQAEPEIPSAADLLAEESEAEIARILWEYGEERWSRRIAQRIVEARSKGQRIETTAQLAALVEGSIPRKAWPRDIHVATRTFQGLRIAVNRELDELKAGLEAILQRLAIGGRAAIISYHSLEDRIVKQTFARAAGRVPDDSPILWPPPEKEEPDFALITRKPVPPTPEEVARNPRARSAKMRVIERTGMKTEG